MSQETSTPAHSADAETNRSQSPGAGDGPSRRSRRFSRSFKITLAGVLLVGGVAYASIHWFPSAGLLAVLDNQLDALAARQRIARRKRAPHNDFNVDNATIPKDEIRDGGPIKDGIPSLTNPKFVDGSRASYLKPDDQVIGVVIQGEAKAYPLRILDYHEAVNDRAGGVPIAVTYCPLCDSAAVFDRRTKSGELEIGISGMLYKSNVLLYDRSNNGNDSLWSQMLSESVAGPRVGEQLATLPVELTTWGDWLTRHPGTAVLSKQTGHRRPYYKRAYAHYFRSPLPYYDVTPVAPRDSDEEIVGQVPLKQRVLGVWTDDDARAYPIGAFQPLKRPQRFKQQLDGVRYTIHYSPQARSLRVVKADGGLQWMYAFWFAWYAFHPNTDLAEIPQN